MGQGRRKGRPPIPPATSRPLGGGVQELTPFLLSYFAKAELGSPRPFLPDHTLQDFPLILVQTHGKGAAVGSNNLYLVHFDLRCADLEGRPRSASRALATELPAPSCSQFPPLERPNKAWGVGAGVCLAAL